MYFDQLNNLSFDFRLPYNIIDSRFDQLWGDEARAVEAIKSRDSFLLGQRNPSEDRKWAIG